MFAECGAADTHVDSDVAHGAAQYAHELSLRLGALKMQATQRATHGGRKVVLYESLVEACVGVAFGRAGEVRAHRNDGLYEAGYGPDDFE